MADRFNRLDVSYDDKEWGNIIDPGEWNANFHEIENGFNALVDDLNSGILRPEDEENFTAVYGETTSAELEDAYDDGKKVFLIYEGIQFTMVRLAETDHIFFGFTMADGGDLTVISIRCTANNWTNPLVGVYKTIDQNNNTFVPLTRTVNGKALSSNITLTPADVGAPTLSALATAIADWNARAIGLDEDIADETTARQTADSTLQTNIDNEATARQSGDRTLQTNINNLETSLKNYTDNAIPKKVSELQNDSGYLTSETDPTVPAWAKQTNKPSYTANEVGALPNTTVIPTKTSDLTNDSGFITDADIPEGSAASSTTPLMDGVANVGTELTFARGDHRHPTDTSRAPAVHTHAISDVAGLQTALNGKADSGDVPDISGKLDKSGGTMTGKLTLDGNPTSNLHAATKQYVDSGLSKKQNTLTFDNIPTSGSTNPVTSGGIYTELETVKTSVSNGKSAIASAITDKGVSTSGSDSFATMASNIGNIETGHTITVNGEEYDNDIDLVDDLGRFEVYSTTYPANLGSKYTLRPNLIVYNNELYKIGESFTYGTSGMQSYITRTVQKWDGSSWTTLTQIPIANLDRFGLVVKDNVIHYYKADDSTISHYTFNGTTWTFIGTENVDLTSFSRTINNVYCIHNAFIYNDTVYLASILKDSDTYYCLYFMKYNGANWVQATELGSSYRFRMKSVFNSNSSSVGANNISNFVVYNNEIHYLVTYSNSGTWKAYRFKNGSWSIIDSNLNLYNNVQSSSNATSPVWLEVHNDSICCAIAVSWNGGSSNTSPIHYSLWYKNSTWNNKRALIPVTSAHGEASGFISWNGELHYIGASTVSSSSATKFWYKFIENYVIE